ncbi:MotE family protein [Bacillus thermotolerans]|uniref:Flagellar protein FlbB n=1 Tax=Bacillus thermotolerans TaxID=1221996 RepID=A0A0F5IAK9_BACTR|nr:MotE family protein [Bacillus thermotolerans]KKB42360.1 Flagellar protein FlbB [Bacillus thermotolerans]KKB44669.1 Flagellar protein FlbB [Bacillus thermotolerans]
MAKKKKAAYADREEGKGYGVFQWIIFMIVIPLLFALLVTLIVMTVAGINVLEKAKELPVISQIMDEESADNGKENNERVALLKEEAKQKDVKIQELEKELEQSKREVEELLTEKDRLELEIQKMKEQEKEKEEKKAQDRSIISTYESMSPKNVANILVNLTDDEAVEILSEMSTDQQADILEKLPPETAAKYTGLLSGSS